MELPINPLFNVHDKYKEMHIINPYRFGVGGNGLLNNLVSGWEFEETSGSTAFDAHGSNDGTNSGATINQTGKVGQCYDFDAANDDRVTILDNSTITFTDGAGNDEPFSINMWVNMDVIANYWFINKRENSGTQDEYQLIFFNGSINFSCISSTGNLRAVKAVTLSTATWYMITVTYDGSNSHLGMSVYINGTLQTLTENNDTGYSGMPDGTAPLMIGSWFTGSAYNGSMDGKIDQVFIWNEELNSNQVSALYNSGNGLAYSEFTT